MEGFLKKKGEYTVKEISSILSQVISSELFMDISIRGEIVSKSEKNRVTYMTLMDSSQSDLPANKKDTIRVVLFDWYAKDITCSFEEGDEVVVQGSLNYYAPSSSISLRATYISPYGEGAELLKLKKLEEKLTKEGLFDPSRKRKIPTDVKKIAIITSASGAAYHDIMETLSHKVPVSTVLFDCLVQGQDAPSSMIRALKRAYASDADLIIFGRGGGSKTDLSCYNDEALVRMLASSPKPVITGIGHEIDRSLCDLAADYYAITPTAAADAALMNLEDVLLSLSQMKDNLSRAFQGRLDKAAYEVADLYKRLEEESPLVKISLRSGQIKDKSAMLNQMFSNDFLKRKLLFADRKAALDGAYRLLGLHPGLALIRKQGSDVKSVKDLNRGDEVEIGFSDGVALSTIKQVF